MDSLICIFPSFSYLDKFNQTLLEIRDDSVHITLLKNFRDVILVKY